MSNNIVPFNFEDHQVRVVMVNDEPWFVLADLCRVLDLSNPSMVAQRLDEADLSLTEVSSGGQRRQATTVNESGMYQVVLRSDKPEAVTFRRWITGTVLPEIRKTGSFSEPKSLEQRSLELIGDLNTEVLKLTAKVERDAPKVDYVDTFVADSDLRLVRNVAKSLDMTEGQLRADLLERKWIYVEHMSRWSESKQEKEEVARYSAYSHKSAYFYPAPNHTAPRFKGEVMHTLKITPAGAIAIARLFGKHLQAVA